MASNRSRSNRSVGNKLNNLDSRVSRGEKGTNNPHLSPDVIEESHLQDASVAEGKLADRAVTENKIARGAIGTEHLGIVNTLTADSGLTLKPGPDGGFIVIDGPEYVAPAVGSGDLYALAFNENNQVVVSTTGVGGGDGIAAMPAGSIQPWPTNVAPEGWLLCDGAAVSRTTYQYLFQTLVPSLGTFTVTVASPGVFTVTSHGLTIGDGVYLTTTGALPTGLAQNTMYYVASVPTVNTFTLTATRTNTVTGYSLGAAINTSGTQSGTHTLWSCRFGNGNGTTTFNVPDLRGRVIVGRDSTQTEFDSLGERGGAKTHTLTQAETPSHTHTGTTSSDGNHSHYITTYNDDFNDIGGDGGTGPSFSKRNDSPGTTRNTGTNTTGAHTHTFTTSSIGSDGAHNNLQPYVTLNYIIKHMQADGMQGPQGIQGEPGDAATVTVGTTTTGSAGSVATVTNAGTTSAAVLNFTIPRGDTGATGSTGPQGPSGTVAVGSTSTGVEGTDAQVTNSGTSTNAVLEFVIPRGNSATVAVGSTTNPDYGTPASVTNSGDNHAAIFDFAIPKGRAATATAGTTSTLSEDNSATVTNAGTTSDAVFNFDIPQGKTGNPAGVKFAFSTTTTDADPGNGIVRVDNSTLASITNVFIDNLDASGADQTTWYQQWDDTTNVHSKGYLYLAEYRTNNVLVLRITGAVTAATGYYKVPVTYVAGALPANSANTFISYSQSGDQGISVPEGGATGQILAKDSNADYDFVWIDNYADWTSQIKHRVKAAESLTLGQAVYVSGSDGTNMLVSKASNATEATSSKTMGLIMQTLSTNGQGFVITEGLISNLDTSTATQGDPVWLGTDGNLIYGLANKPVAPAHLVFIGIVTRVNANVGEIYVKVQNGFELKEIHDVLISNPQNGQALTYDSATGLWKNSTPASNLDSLTDVTLTAPLVDKQVLKYDDATSQWINAVATGGVTVSATAPAEPYPGDAWYDSTDGSMYVYYDDGDSSPPRTNLISNPSFETNVSGWGYSGVATVTTTTSQSYVGSSSASIQYIASQPRFYYVGPSGIGFSVSPGEVYTASAYVKQATTGSNFYIAIEWFTSGGVSIVEDAGSTASATTSTWTRGSVTATAPSGAAIARVGIYNQSNHYVDAVLLEQSATLGNYIEGTVGSSGGSSAQWVEVKSTAVPTNFSGVEARVTTAENDIVALESNVATLQSTQILTSNVNTFTANQNFSASGTFINGDNGTITAKTSSAGKVPVVAQGASGQYANLQEWMDSTGSVLSRVDSLGRITQSAVPAFSVGGTGSQSWSGGAAPAKVIMQGAVFTNRGGHYSTTNSRFTAPVAGVYEFHMSSCVTTNATGPEIWVYKNGSVVHSTLAIGYDAFYNTFGSTIILDLSVNDFVEMYIQNNNGTSFTIDRGRSMFSGFLIG